MFSLGLSEVVGWRDSCVDLLIRACVRLCMQMTVLKVLLLKVYSLYLLLIKLVISPMNSNSIALDCSWSNLSDHGVEAQELDPHLLLVLV